MLFYVGIAVCATVAVTGVLTAIMLRILKIRLDKQLDSEYGNRRR